MVPISQKFEFIIFVYLPFVEASSFEYYCSPNGQVEPLILKKHRNLCFAELSARRFIILCVSRAMHSPIPVSFELQNIWIRLHHIYTDRQRNLK